MQWKTPKGWLMAIIFSQCCCVFKHHLEVVDVDIYIYSLYYMVYIYIWFIYNMLMLMVVIFPLFGHWFRQTPSRSTSLRERFRSQETWYPGAIWPKAFTWCPCTLVTQIGCFDANYLNQSRCEAEDGSVFALPILIYADYQLICSSF